VDSRSPAFAEDKLRGNDPAFPRDAISNDTRTQGVKVQEREASALAEFCRSFYESSA
jgi:hypothetical protein